MDSAIYTFEKRIENSMYLKIPLEDVIIDNTIFVYLKKYSSQTIPKYIQPGSARLPRLKKFIKEIRNGRDIEPVILERKRLYMPPMFRIKNINHCKYEILDGRHRVTAALILGRSEIPASIYEDRPSVIFT